MAARVRVDHMALVGQATGFKPHMRVDLTAQWADESLQTTATPSSVLARLDGRCKSLWDLCG
jgi:hypothetical protein